MNIIVCEQKIHLIAELKKIVIDHSQFNDALTKLVNAYEMNLKAGVSEHIICIGQSGTGKSTLKERMQQSVCKTLHSEKSLTPVLIVDTPALPTVKNLAEEMLMKLGDSRFHSGSTIQKTTRVHHYLEQCEVKMIIFDELQHFIDRGNDRKTFEVADWLKTVIDRSKCSVVLMGLERCELLFRINEQLRRRFSKRIQLSSFIIDSQESLSEFIGVIDAIVGKLGLESRIDARDKAFIKALYYATDGVIANLIKLFIGVLERIDLSSRCEIEMHHFEQAFTENIWIDGKEQLNPFNKKFIWQRLSKPGMPFHRLDFLKKDEKNEY